MVDTTVSLIEKKEGGLDDFLQSKYWKACYR